MNPSIVKRCLVGAVLAIAATLPGFQQLHTSVEGLKLIADYEGCRLQPYQCSAGSWFEYEPATGRWYVRGIKSMVIEAADNITMKTSEFVLEADRTRINSEVVINGGVTQGGGAMSSNGIVVDAHQHTGVLKGGDTTGGPV
ncbi:phage baseplate assembly protein V [Escherichia coli]|uniref:phage baseplate assembly protein V n=1 Tax=Escherichia coli TaxID=562 RepID=UPI000DA5BC84|nr:phage baseplate assembly protein V [Escherichia coli]EFM6086145.1 phage baseplate assembly protein V [Escherichia coli]EGF4766001.1 phage baseplate assembly protein V [Escherichia coli]MCV8635146.1 phage baseplate assembly protein V [Escherichia coli]MCV8718056.1 phage baseplate assembly protein V [Escherichia coli]MCV9276950.1 phage baseplate assembly protein V [Escherichia coli]